MLGFVWSGTGTPDQSGEKIGIVFGLAVKVDHQRKGIGKKLMKHEIDYFRSNNINQIIVTVEKGNKRSMNFFKYFGFKQQYKIMELTNIN